MILMMKNEEKILKRCLEAVESIVDGYCILDTGSTDSTKEIALDFLKTRVGCLTEDPFKDFGYSRTKSFNNAQKYLKENTDWDLAQTYGILLDADMVFVPGTLKQQILTAIGYSVIQKNGGMEYYNARLVRMDHPWTCRSVTHEYWDGHTEKLSKEVCFIDDKNDGGCKSDKFERDKRLLEKGLVDEPENVRYMFYLAQTYKCLGDFKKSIDMYEKRINAGGWNEELYYSMYMIGECYLNLKDTLNFERYMQMAYHYRPSRGETIYKLAEHYRNVSDHYKSYHYIQLGRKIPFPKDDVLFIEPNVYSHLFDFEASIVEYYIHPERGLGSSMSAMMNASDKQHNIVANLKHYVKPLSGNITNLNFSKPFGDVYNPSAVSVCNYPFANVRFVNYKILPDGSYHMPNGIVDTKNAYFNLETMECVSAFGDPDVKFDSHIKGLEDLRLYSENNKLYFTATSVNQYIQGKICIAHGEYDYMNKSYKDCVGVESPNGSDCEKNWVHVPGTSDFIYGWHPLKIGNIEGNKFNITKSISVPPFFSMLRGSAPPVEVNGKWLVLTHFVEHCQPRNYYHCFVELDKQMYFPTKVSFPFVFRKAGIEFCISGRALSGDQVEFYASSWDRDPFKICFNLSSLAWFHMLPNEPPKNNIVRVPSSLNSYWDGGYSRCLAGNSIEQYVNQSINKQKLNISAIFSLLDGLLGQEEYARQIKLVGRVANISENSYYNLRLRKLNNTKSAIVTLCSRQFNPADMLLVPLDDDTFTHGLQKVLSNFKLPKWEERNPKVFWRGGSSGYDRPSVRMEVTKKLFTNPNADVRITKWGNWENEKDIPEEHFGDRCDLQKHFYNKYIFIIDGNCIASNHQWVFGSGSVPIMITHPENNYWFKKFLKPMENYVPIQYDLSDLEEKLEWLIKNDDKAKQIAENAVSFSNTVFSPEFQRKYIDSELLRISNLNENDINNKIMLDICYEEKCKSPSDINEHLPTLKEYASKCSSVVECGVRGITSSYAFASGLKHVANNSLVMIDIERCSEIDNFIDMCKNEGVSASFVHQSDLECPLVETDMFFIDTWHVYAQLKRELARWNSSVKKYIIMHDTTVDEWLGETIRGGLDADKQSKESGFPKREILRGLWPAVEEFLEDHPEWVIEKRYTNNNGLTILARN